MRTTIVLLVVGFMGSAAILGWQNHAQKQERLDQAASNLADNLANQIQTETDADYAPPELTAPRCATKSEYGKISNGMSESTVRSILGAGKGRRSVSDVDFNGQSFKVVNATYGACTSNYASVLVTFQGNAVVLKQAFW